jgi:hypothetical protein
LLLYFSIDSLQVIAPGSYYGRKEKERRVRREGGKERKERRL